MVVEEEREESMDTDVPASPAAPVPLKKMPMWECLEARDPDDHCSHTSEECTNQNPPHDSDPNEDELLGPITFPFLGYIQTTPSHLSSPRGRQLVTIKHESLVGWDSSQTGQNGMGLGLFEPASPASHNGSWSIFAFFYLLTMCCFLNKVVIMKSCRRAWGRVSHAACHPLAWVIIILHFIAWPSCAWGLWVCAVSCHLFPTTCFPHSRFMVMCDIWWHDPCIISVHHPELCTLYKRAGNYHLGLLFPETQWDKGLGSDLDLGVTSTLGLGSKHHCTLLFGSPSPWQLWFIHHVLSIVFCVSRNLQPVHIQVGLSLLILECTLGLKAPHQE